MSKSRRRNRKYLRMRIAGNLVGPLLFLAAVFTAVQLTNQMSVMNEFYKLESRFAYEVVQKALSAQLKQPGATANLSSLESKLKQIENFHRIEPINIYSLYEKKPLLPDRDKGWRPPDFHAIEKSLYQKQQGRSYEVEIDKRSGTLTAYIPIDGANAGEVYIARVIFPLAHVKDALFKSFGTLGIMGFFILLTGVFIGMRMSKSIVDPIRELNLATREIMEGNLGKHVHINTHDEIEGLASTFNQMSESLKDMKSRAEDANPLTGLPGNQGIFHELKKRIHERRKFVLFHTDLDRFKVFNDHFGLARGDEAIKRTADVIRNVLRERGASDDFIGHQGGDDFVIIVRADHAREMAELIISEFDKKVVTALYPKEDLERGFTLQLDRRRLAETGEERMAEFPLLAISLAGVSNMKKDFADYFDCMNQAVAAKKEAKKKVESSYVMVE